MFLLIKNVGKIKKNVKNAFFYFKIKNVKNVFTSMIYTVPNHKELVPPRAQHPGYGPASISATSLLIFGHVFIFMLKRKLLPL